MTTPTRTLTYLFATALVLPLTLGSGGQPSAGVHAGTEARRLAPQTEEAGESARAGAPPAAWRPYARTSPWNTPIQSNPPLARRSDAKVRSLVRAGKRRGWTIGGRNFGVPVFYVGRRAPRRDVKLVDRWRAADRLLNVPLPKRAFPDPKIDGHMAIVDRGRRCEWDFYAADKRGKRSWRAIWANRIELNSDGVFDRGAGARASSFALLAGLLRPAHFARGTIDHALVFAYPYTKRGNIGPATTNDGRRRGFGYMREGARLQLDPRLDVESLGLPAWQQVIARTLQTYGMYLADTSGGPISLFAQHPRSDTGGLAYPWGSTLYPALPLRLLPHFRVLASKPRPDGFDLKIGGGNVVPSRCGRFEGLLPGRGAQ